MALAGEGCSAERGQGGQGGAGPRVSSLAPHGAEEWKGPYYQAQKAICMSGAPPREEGRTQGQVLTKQVTKATSPSLRHNSPYFSISSPPGAPKEGGGGGGGPPFIG